MSTELKYRKPTSEELETAKAFSNATINGFAIARVPTYVAHLALRLAQRNIELGLESLANNRNSAQDVKADAAELEAFANNSTIIDKEKE